MDENKPSCMYLFVAGVVSSVILLWIANLHENLGVMVGYIGWIIPAAFFYGAFTGE